MRPSVHGAIFERIENPLRLRALEIGTLKETPSPNSCEKNFFSSDKTGNLYLCLLMAVPSSSMCNTVREDGRRPSAESVGYLRMLLERVVSFSIVVGPENKQGFPHIR